MRVVLDTNLIVRAARPHAGLAPSILLEALSDRHVLLLSNGLFSEIYKVLNYERVRQVHGLNDTGVHEFFDAIAQGAEIVVMQPLGPGPLVPADPTDDTVLLTAIHGRADALGTIRSSLLCNRNDGCGRRARNSDHDRHRTARFVATVTLRAGR